MRVRKRGAPHSGALSRRPLLGRCQPTMVRPRRPTMASQTIKRESAATATRSAARLSKSASACRNSAARLAFHYVEGRRGNDDGVQTDYSTACDLRHFRFLHAIVNQTPLIDGPADLLGLLDVRKRTLPHHRQRLCARRRWLRDN